MGMQGDGIGDGRRGMGGTETHLRQLTRTPCLAHSTASDAAMCFTAAFAALYGVCGCGMFTICTPSKLSAK